MSNDAQRRTALDKRNERAPPHPALMEIRLPPLSCSAQLSPAPGCPPSRPLQVVSDLLFWSIWNTHGASLPRFAKRQSDRVLAGNTKNRVWRPGRALPVTCVLRTTAGLVVTPSLLRRGCGGTSPVRRLARAVRSIDQNYLPAADATPTWFPSRHEQVIFVAASRPARTTRKVMQMRQRTVVQWKISRLCHPKEVLAVFMSKKCGMGTAAISERDRPHRVPRRVTLTESSTVT